MPALPTVIRSVIVRIMNFRPFSRENISEEQREDTPANPFSQICRGSETCTVDIKNDVEFDYFVYNECEKEKVTKICINHANRIHKIPLGIGKFSNLLTLNLRDNYIDDIPWSIIYLTQLKEMDVSYNMLTCLPKTIGFLTDLEYLDVSANHLTHLPTEILQLRNLKVINISYNHKLKSPIEGEKTNLGKIKEELLARSQRKNMWENSKPYVGTDSPKDLSVKAKTLLALCVETILKYKVDFLLYNHVPPVIKSQLREFEQEFSQRIKVAKCSTCRNYFSSDHNFDSHQCSRT